MALLTEAGSEGKRLEPSMWADRFKDSLRPDIATILANKDFGTITDVFESARKVDNLLKKKEAVKKSPTVNAVETSACEHCGKRNHRTAGCWQCHSCKQY